MRKKLSILLILIMLTAVFTPFLPPAATEQSPLPLFTTEAEAALIKLNTAGSSTPLRMNRELSVKGTSKKVSRITLNKTSVSVVKGKSITLKATISPSNATNKAVIWRSSNTKVAKVSSKGVVKGIAKGTAKITVKAADGSGRKATCTVTVKTAKSGVPNVTDSVLKKTAAGAAKYLKLTKKVSEYNPEGGYYEYYYVRKGRRLHDGSPSLYCPTVKPARAGDWDIDIRDKSIAFQGVKVGMSESSAKKLLAKKWRYEYKYYPEKGEYALSYSRNLNHSWSWLGEDGRAKLSLTFNKKTKKVKAIEYYTDQRD